MLMIISKFFPVSCRCKKGKGGAGGSGGGWGAKKGGGGGWGAKKGGGGGWGGKKGGGGGWGGKKGGGGGGGGMQGGGGGMSARSKSVVRTSGGRAALQSQCMYLSSDQSCFPYSIAGYHFPFLYSLWLSLKLSLLSFLFPFLFSLTVLRSLTVRPSDR